MALVDSLILAVFAGQVEMHSCYLTDSFDTVKCWYNFWLGGALCNGLGVRLAV